MFKDILPSQGPWLGCLDICRFWACDILACILQVVAGHKALDCGPFPASQVVLIRGWCTHTVHLWNCGNFSKTPCQPVIWPCLHLENPSGQFKWLFEKSQFVSGWREIEKNISHNGWVMLVLRLLIWPTEYISGMEQNGYSYSFTLHYVCAFVYYYMLDVKESFYIDYYRKIGRIYECMKARERFFI